MAIVDLKTNKVLSNREIKREVMRLKGWNSDQYKKEYDILRNKTRNYETITGQKSGTIAVNELLYTTAKAEKRYGARYRASKQVQAILATPSTGTAVVQKKGVSQRTLNIQENLLLSQFAGFTSKSTEGAEILQKYEQRKSGFFDDQIRELQKEKSEKRKLGTLTEAESQIIDAQIKQLKEEKAEAPRDLAELRKRLDSAARSLREYQKTKAGEWKKKHPDAPATYGVGTP